MRYASRPDGRNVPGWTAQAEGSPRPTLIRGPGATEHLRSDRHRPTGFARLAQPPAQPAAALQRLPGCATAGARPAAALAAGWKEGGACADPRATFVERAKRAEPARRPAARVGRGRPAGRGVRAAAPAAGGTPSLFPLRYGRPGPARSVRAAGPDLPTLPGRCGLRADAECPRGGRERV